MADRAISAYDPAFDPEAAVPPLAGSVASLLPAPS